MGYTHYFTFKNPKRGQARAAETKFKLAVEACQTIVYLYNKGRIDETRLSGYTAHTKPGEYGGVNFNGLGELGHEDFVLREHYRDNVGFHFCKTAQKPYDIVVVACLTVLKHHLGELMDIGSDGRASDWIDGVLLARKILPDKSIQCPIGAPIKGAV